MISLGCAKNLVDAEIMLGSVLERGCEITSRADEADVLVVNTCAFIDSAKEESIEAILEAHQERGLNEQTGAKVDRERLHVAALRRANCASNCRKWMLSSGSIRCANSARSSSACSISLTNSSAARLRQSAARLIFRITTRRVFGSRPRTAFI